MASDSKAESAEGKIWFRHPDTIWALGRVLAQDGDGYSVVYTTTSGHAQADQNELCARIAATRSSTQRGSSSLCHQTIPTPAMTPTCKTKKTLPA